MQVVDMLHLVAILVVDIPPVVVMLVVVMLVVVILDIRTVLHKFPATLVKLLVMEA